LFEAFSPRESILTSLENALTAKRQLPRIGNIRDDFGCPLDPPQPCEIGRRGGRPDARDVFDAAARERIFAIWISGRVFLLPKNRQIDLSQLLESVFR
jgi:hypothetical protein